MPRNWLALPLAGAIALAPASQAAAPSAPSASAGDSAAESLEWLERYLRLDTTNPPGSEVLAVGFLRDLLEKHGIATEVIASPAGRPNLLARLPASQPGAPRLLLVHHTDVVPPGAGWTALPFSGERRAGSIWGRGAVDDKSLGIAELAALLDAAAIPNRRCEIDVLAVADEESGGVEGSGWLVAHHPELFEHVEAVLNEGGENRVISGKQLYWGIEVAQKRPLWLLVTARGRGGHGAGLNPASAAHQLIEGLARLLARKPEWRVSDPVRTFFAAIAPHDPNLAPLSAHLDEWIAPAGPKHPLLPGIPGYFLDTVQVTRLEASERINVVASEARAWIDVRLLPETDDVAFLRAAKQALGSDLETEVLLSAPRVLPSPTTTPAFARIAGVLAAEAPVVPAFISGMTDSRYFRGLGIPSYGFSPFRLEAEALRGIHGADEHIPVDAFLAGVEKMKRVVAALVAPEDPPAASPR